MKNIEKSDDDGIDEIILLVLEKCKEQARRRHSVQDFLDNVRDEIEKLIQEL